MILLGIVFILLFSITCILIGYQMLALIGWKKTFVSTYAWGIITIFATFHLIAYPLYRIGSSFMLLFWVYLSVLTVLLFSSILTVLKTNGTRLLSDDLHNTFDQIKKNPILSVVLVAFVIIHIFVSVGFYYSSSDDGFYLTKGMEAIRQNTLSINDTMAWLGRDNAPVTNYENGSTYSFFLAFLSQLSKLPVTALAKTFFLFNLIFAHLAAVLTAADVIFEKKDNLFQKKSLLLILYIVFQLFCVKEGSSGSWMTGFLYEGKSILIAVVFPLLLASCFILMKRIAICRKREWISIAVLLTAAAELSVIGTVFPAILYFSFGIAILIGDRFRSFRRIWFPALLSALPAVVFALLSFFGASDFITQLGGITSVDYVSAGSVTSGIAASSTSSGIVRSLLSQALAWKDHFLYSLDFWQFVLYLISVLFILFKGGKEQKVLFVLSPVILLLTFLNPFLSNLVAAKITTPIVYWRLFWLLPVYFLPAFALSELADRLSEGRIERCLITSILTVGILGGFELFRYSVTAVEYTIIPYAKNFGKLINIRPELRFNVYNLNPGPLNVAQIIENDWDQTERPRLLFCCNRPFEVRQYTTEITMVADVRNYSSIEGYVPGTNVKLADFAQTYSQVTDGNYLRSMLEKLNVDYVCFDGASAVPNLEDFGFRYVGTSCTVMEIWQLL